MSAAGRVVLVHGLWMHGFVFGVLRHRLERDFGFEVSAFSYPTLHGDIERVVSDLAAFAARAPGDGPVHLVGHSLGGLLVYRVLERFPQDVFGNAVVLGSPLRGSKAARGASEWPVLRPLLGPHVLAEVAPDPERRWHGRNRIGAIAGSLRVGTGQFFAHFDEDNDGTIGVSETLIPGLSDHLVVPHSHIGMLFAEDVAAQVARFLLEGRFRRHASPPGGSG